MEMNLPSLTRLKKLNTKDSAFTGYVIADGAPISIFTINEPESLELSNLFYLTKENQNFNIQSYSKLRKIDIKNIDYNDVNSKELIDNMIKAAESANNKDFEYNLENVKWTFSEADNITNNNIPLLDYILTYGTPIDNKLSRLALTGTADIPDSAYNGNNALQLYEKYCLKKTDNRDFANLILNFINSDGTKKLCSITIKNGNGENKWYRQFNSFDNINNDYLSQSSFGAFDVRGTVTKRNENEVVYTFDDRWKCTAGNKQFEIKGTDVNTQYLDLSLIKDALAKHGISDDIKDIIIEPVFSEDVRYYSVTFKDSISGNIIHSVDNAIYGSTFEMIKPKTLPYKSDIDLPLEETYYLKGYTTTIATENESPMLTEENTWRLTDNTVFYPVFERRNVYTIDYSNYLWYEGPWPFIGGGFNV